MIPEIRKVCKGMVTAVLRKAKDDKAIDSSDLDCLEQVSRILRNVDSVKPESAAQEPIDISTEELIKFVRPRTPKGKK